jgi:hypothetical protein
MPVHDWTRVDAGLFHHFHQAWTLTLCNALNAGGLPPDYFALVEQQIRGPVPDVLTLKLSGGTGETTAGRGGLALAEVPPRMRVVRRSDADVYAQKANRITVRHRHGDVAVIEIVSPGNKASRWEFRAFVQKSVGLIRQCIHLLVIDLLPPGPRDPQGLPKAIWDEFGEEDLGPPPGKPLTLAAYNAEPDDQKAFVEFIGVGDPLPEMPLFLQPGYYVLAPLEASYRTAWQGFPNALKGLLEPPAAPRPENP